MGRDVIEHDGERTWRHLNPFLLFFLFFKAPTGLSTPRLYPFNQTSLDIEWDPPAKLNGPHPLYQVSDATHSVQLEIITI